MHYKLHMISAYDNAFQALPVLNGDTQLQQLRRHQVKVRCKHFSLTDWISDTLSQGYANLQSLVKCLGHRDIASDTVCSQARLCEAAQCIEMHLGGYIYSHGQ